jgi:hypothetical protein
MSEVLKCRSCSALIVWLRTRKGVLMPVDAKGVDPADEVYDREKHTSHFASCPDARKHRRPRG